MLKRLTNLIAKRHTTKTKWRKHLVSWVSFPER